MKQVLEKIYQLLASDETLHGLVPGGIYFGTVPDRASFPLILMQLVGVEDDYLIGTRARLRRIGTLEISIIGKTSDTGAVMTDIVDRIDELLFDHPFSDVIYCRRESINDFEINLVDEVFLRVVARYRIEV